LFFIFYREVVNFALLHYAGGVLITPEEIRAAFEFLDVDGEKKVSMSGLKRRLQVFFPNMTTKEYRLYPPF
jgi:hypothetical protein